MQAICQTQGTHHGKHGNEQERGRDEIREHQTARQQGAAREIEPGNSIGSQAGDDHGQHGGTYRYGYAVAQKEQMGVSRKTVA